MRAVILGGSGVFGSRLAQLLCRDGHEVVIAARNLKRAQTIAKKIGAEAICVDRRNELSAIFGSAQQGHPDIVIDAAGPFQDYGTDRYALAKACIARKVHYLDLSDDADFTSGISALDDAARKAGCVVISGASSVPGLSSSVVEALSKDMDHIEVISSTILPGNRAPRGFSVMRSILMQAGRPVQIWRGGAWRAQPGWSDRRVFNIDETTHRAGYFIEVPDIKLFPKHFHANSVLFHAGLELGIMNRSLRWLSVLRGYWPFKITGPIIRLVQWFATLLLPFGSDRGAMLVNVTGRLKTGMVTRSWRLIAENGEGPFVPALLCRALLRDFDHIAPGARPALAELPLERLENSMMDLAITTSQRQDNAAPLFERVLGPDWERLSAQQRQLHEVYDLKVFSGRAHIRRGRSALARLIAFIFGFPKAGRDVPVSVSKSRRAGGEIWERNFAGRIFRSHLTPAFGPNEVFERFGPFRFLLDLPVTDTPEMRARMGLSVRRGWFLGLPMPRFLLPQSESCEYAQDGMFHFDVAIKAPFTGETVVHYQGSLAEQKATKVNGS